MKPYRHVWRLLSVLSIIVLTSLMIHPPLIIPVDATKSTWLIENETIVIENIDLVHEGDIIIRGTGQLALVNSSLTIKQLLSWQFQIKVEDTGMFSVDDSGLRSKYPFKIECNGYSEINLVYSSSSNAMIIMNDDSCIFCADSKLFGITTNEQSRATIDSCVLRTVTSSDDSLFDINRSELGSIGINDNSQTNITASQIGPVVVESNKPTNINDCTAEALRGWGESKIIVSGCMLGDYRYSDNVEASFSNSSIGDLDATGILPLTLNQIVIGSAILRGSANVTMNECSVGTLEVYLYSSISLWNSTCGDFLATQYADVKILGNPSVSSYLGHCVITQMCTAIITWSNFDYLEIAHSSTAQVNDSYVYNFQNWEYTTCRVDINRCRFYMFRGTGSTFTISDSIIELWANIAIGAEFNATSCEFLADLIFYDTAQGFFENCTMNLLRPQHETQIILRNCTALVLIVDYSNRVRTVDSVPGGYLAFWNSLNSNAFQNVQWNLTVYDTNITGWDLNLWHEEDYIIVNSTLRKVWVSAQCSVNIEESSIEELWASNGETEVLRAEIMSIWVQNAACLTLNECVCDVIYNLNDAKSIHYNSTFDRFYSRTLSECHLFNCFIRSVGPTDNSHVYLENCTMTYLDSSQYAITNLVNCTVETHLGIMDYTITYVVNSTVALLVGYQTSQAYVSASTIGELVLFHSPEIFMSDCILGYFNCMGTSHLSISGNYSGTTSCAIQNSAQVFREFNIVVEDQLGNLIQSASVEIYDSLGNPVIAGISNAEGICDLTIIFEIGGISFFSTFTVFVSLGSANTTIAFTISTPQPLVTILDLSEPFSSTHIETDIGSSQELENADILEEERNYVYSNQSIPILNTFDFVIGILCFAALALFIIREDVKYSLYRLRCSKLNEEVKR